MKITLGALMEIVGGVPSGTLDLGTTVDTSLLNFDSRKIAEGEIFFAFSTEKHDGAKNIGDALGKGAALAIAKHNPSGLAPVVLVDDPLKALQNLGRYVRSQYKGFVIGITGSSGKTTSKDLIVRMLSHFGKTSFSQGSFNNHIGTPFSLCKLDLEAPFAVFEMGMNRSGEIASLVRMVQPHLAAVTNVFPMHMEFFDSFEDIAYAKAEIFQSVVPFNGQTVAVINADANFADDVLIPMAQRCGIGEIVTFGRRGGVRLKDFTIDKDGLTTDAEIVVGTTTFHGLCHGLGERFAYNATMAATVASALGLDVGEALDSIAHCPPPKGRGKISTVTLDSGFDITVIDDSYNAQPEAMRYAISSLKDIPKHGARKIALLGKMTEIGDGSKQEHLSLGRALSDSDVDVVIGVGPETKFMFEEIPDSVTKIYKDTIEGLYDELVGSILRPQDILLIKGAHYSSRVFEIAERLLKSVA